MLGCYSAARFKLRAGSPGARGTDVIAICENREAWDEAARRSFYPFVAYRYGWLEAWAAANRDLTPLFVASMGEGGRCDYVCPLYLDSKARVISGAVGVTPGFISADVPPEEVLSFLVGEARHQRLKKIVLQIPPGYSYCNNLMRGGFVLRRKVSFYVLHLEGIGSFSEYLDAVPNKGKRCDIKLALRSGLAAWRGGYAPDSFGRFAPFLVEMARRHGAELPEEDLYRTLADHYGRDLLIWIAACNGADVGSALTLASGDRLWIMWLQGGARHRHLKVDTFLYAEIIRYAIENGFRSVNFGTSPIDTPLGDFKRRLGAQPEFHEQYELDLALPGVVKQCGSRVKGYLRSRWGTL